MMIGLQNAIYSRSTKFKKALYRQKNVKQLGQNGAQSSTYTSNKNLKNWGLYLDEPWVHQLPTS